MRLQQADEVPRHHPRTVQMDSSTSTCLIPS
jgi:hypothetical protein